MVWLTQCLLLKPKTTVHTLKVIRNFETLHKFGFSLHLYYMSYHVRNANLNCTLLQWKSSTLCNFLPLIFKKVAAIPAFVFETRI